MRAGLPVARDLQYRQTDIICLSILQAPRYSRLGDHRLQKSLLQMAGRSARSAWNSWSQRAFERLSLALTHITRLAFGHGWHHPGNRGRLAAQIAAVPQQRQKLIPKLSRQWLFHVKSTSLMQWSVLVHLWTVFLSRGCYVSGDKNGTRLADWHQISQKAYRFYICWSPRALISQKIYHPASHSLRLRT